MSAFSLSKARNSLLRFAANAENVAQFVLLRDSRPSLQIARQQRRELSSRPRSRKHHRSKPQNAPFIQFAFRPSLQLNTRSLYDTARSRANNTPISYSPPFGSIAAPRFQSTQATSASNSPSNAIPPASNSPSNAIPPASNAPKTASSVGSVQSPESLTKGLSDEPIVLDEQERQVDWARSFHGLSTEAFSKETAAILMAPLAADDIEIKPDGILYLPEIKYRRILNRAFGPGAWGLAPRGETIVTSKAVTREYALLAQGRLISVARGEQDYFSPEGVPTATEGCKSNALMRCAKDLGIASELWDPRFIKKFKSEHTVEVWAEHVVTKKKKRVWRRKDDKLAYPFKES